MLGVWHETQVRRRVSELAGLGMVLVFAEGTGLGLGKIMISFRTHWGANTNLLWISFLKEKGTIPAAESSLIKLFEDPL